MKEATGELNAAVIVILAVGVMIAFFYYTLWPILKNNFDETTKCSQAICKTSADSSGYVECHIKNNSSTFKCVYKG